MKKTNLFAMGAVALLSVSMLAACGADKPATSSSSSTTASTSKSAEAFTGATKGTDDFATLQKGFGKDGAWLNALTKDVDASDKTLTVDGTFVGDGQVARELALYKSGADHKPEATYTLTVKKLEVNSPGFMISQGTVKGDVYVSAPGFGFEGTGKIDGNLVFATEELEKAFKENAEWTKAVSGKISVDTSVKATKIAGGSINVDKAGRVSYNFEGKGADAVTGATTGTKDADVVIKGLSAKGAWLIATTGDIDAAGKTVAVDGTFLNEEGQIQRTLCMIGMNKEHQVEKVYTLTADKLVIKSPQFDFEGGNVKSDVYVAEGASAMSRNMKDTSGADVRSKIDGNLYFATDDQMKTYQALPQNEQFEVTGTVSVKAAE
jgi:hypothetical protein